MNFETRLAIVPECGDPELRSLAATILRMRRHRDKLFGPELFADPAWDMLLELYVGDVKGRPISTGNLVIAGAVPMTTARRCMRRLKQADVFVSITDPLDRRRSLCVLTPSVRRAIEDTLQRFSAHLSTSLRRDAPSQG